MFDLLKELHLCFTKKKGVAFMAFKLRLKVLHFCLCFCSNMCQSFGLLCLSILMVDVASMFGSLDFPHSRIKTKSLKDLFVCFL